MAISIDRNGAEALEKLFDVSRETLERLSLYTELVRKWQPVQNLVAASTLDDIWKRHIVDSAQLVPLLPHAQSWLDFGSGAGFPALVIGICKAANPNFELHLVESNSRKVAFLRTVIRETGISAQVHDCRIETFQWPGRELPDVVSARAVAALSDLCGYSKRFMSEKTVAIFPKGKEYQSEINSALHDWNLDLLVRDSVTDGHGKIIEIRAMNALKKA